MSYLPYDTDENLDRTRTMAKLATKRSASSKMSLKSGTTLCAKSFNGPIRGKITTHKVGILIKMKEIVLVESQNIDSSKMNPYYQLQFKRGKKCTFLSDRYRF